MMMNPTPDLYALHGLSRADSSDEIALLLSGKDAQLENQGVLPDSPRRRQLQVAFAVLKSEDIRAIYDEALDSGRPLSWQEVEYLGNFGSLPDPTLQPGHGRPGPAQPQPQQHPPSPFSSPVDATQQAPYDPTTPGYTNPFHAAPTAPPPAYPGYSTAGHGAADAQDRPSAGLRLGMMLLDSLAASALGGFGALFFFSGTLASIAVPLIGLAYFIGFEVYTGATPAKHLFGYQVRDATTGEKLSLEQSAKRYWWRIVGLIPFIGWMVSFIGMIAIGSSIKPETGNVGSHDRWAGAEVVRKQRR